jgi:hypothetical protein
VLKREGEDVTFDWFKRYEDVAHLLRPVLLDRTARILMLGCGNSTLSEDVRSELRNPCSATHRDSRCMMTDTRTSSTLTCVPSFVDLIRSLIETDATVFSGRD